MKANLKPDIMKKSLKVAFATVLCGAFALTLTFCGSKPAETAETADTVVVETVPADTTVTDTTAVDTTAVK
jgi:hypothetical protein